jgi:hypothetical protein
VVAVPAKPSVSALAVSDIQGLAGEIADATPNKALLFPRAGPGVKRADLGIASSAKTSV